VRSEPFCMSEDALESKPLPSPNLIEPSFD